MRGDTLVRQILVGQANLDRMKAEIAQIVGIFAGSISIFTFNEVEFPSKTGFLWRIYLSEKEDHLEHVIIDGLEPLMGNWRLRRIFSSERPEKISLRDVRTVYGELGILVDGIIDRSPGTVDQLHYLLEAATQKF